MALRRVFICVVLGCMLSAAAGFSVIPNGNNVQQSTTALDMFGSLADAFKNDDSLGARQNAGLKGVSSLT